MLTIESDLPHSAEMLAYLELLTIGGVVHRIIPVQFKSEHIEGMDSMRDAPIDIGYLGEGNV